MTARVDSPGDGFLALRAVPDARSGEPLAKIPHGTTVQELFERQMRQAKPENYLIRVNRQSASRDQVLVEGDRVTFTPTKIEGAESFHRILRVAS